MSRQATDVEVEVLGYLNDLRESGTTNMFGASPYIMDEFSLDKREATRLLSLWMGNFNGEGNYETLENS